jgi:ankyrin repeat protein
MQIGQRTREWILVGLVAFVAILANLPDEVLQYASVDRTWLLGLLALTVFIALFLYLKFQFFFLVVALAIGANMPSSVSESLGISRMPLIIAMAAMVGISLINYVVALLPTGLETKPREKSKEGIVALFYAIEKGNLVYAQKILSMNFDPNLIHDNGYSPLMYAAARGDAKMCELLVRNGADVGMMSRDGDTAMELALRTGSSEVADLLKKARAEQLAREEAARAKEGA